MSVQHILVWERKMQPRNISFNSSFPGLMSAVCFHWAWVLFQIRIFMVIAFANLLLYTTPPEGFWGRIPSPSFFMYLYIWKNLQYLWIRKSWNCMHLDAFYYPQGKPGWVSRPHYAIWLFDTRTDTAFMRDCGVGMTSHCQKGTSHIEDKMRLPLKKDYIRATCAMICVVRRPSDSQEIPWENSVTSVITF